jgi:tRNA(Arg) A34 adenosine deaminase TadA
MFERFTDSARRAVVDAQEEARRFNHSYIGTEHLLIALLLGGDTVAARAAAAVGLDADQARRRLGELIGQGQRPPQEHIPFTPQSKKVLELALREAMNLGDDHIGTEHLMLGLVREGEGIAARLLGEAAGGLERVREAVLARRSESGEPRGSREGQSEARREPSREIEDTSEAGLLAHAVWLAGRNGTLGQLPYGAVVVRDGAVLATCVDLTKGDHDPTAHAEIGAIRGACALLGTLSLAGATLVSSCEPCDWCRAVAAGAGITRIVYAAPRASVPDLGEPSAPPALPDERVVHVPTDGADEPFRAYLAWRERHEPPAA